MPIVCLLTIHRRNEITVGLFGLRGVEPYNLNMQIRQCNGDHQSLGSTEWGWPDRCFPSHHRVLSFSLKPLPALRQLLQWWRNFPSSPLRYRELAWVPGHSNRNILCSNCWWEKKTQLSPGLRDIRTSLEKKWTKDHSHESRNTMLCRSRSFLRASSFLAGSGSYLCLKITVLEAWEAKTIHLLPAQHVCSPFYPPPQYMSLDTASGYVRQDPSSTHGIPTEGSPLTRCKPGSNQSSRFLFFI